MCGYDNLFTKRSVHAVPEDPPRQELCEQEKFEREMVRAFEELVNGERHYDEENNF